MEAAGFLGTLWMQMTADVADLKKNVNDAQNTVSKAAKKMNDEVEGVKRFLKGLAAAFLIKEIAHFVGDTLEAVDALKKFSEETNIAIDTLGGLKFAADKANIGDIFEQGLRKFSEQLRQAQAEGSNAQLLIRDILHIDPNEQNLDKAFRQAVESISSYKDGVEKMGLVQEAFGTKNARFINLLNEGTDALDRNSARFKELIGSDLPDAADMANKFNDSMTELKVAVMGVGLAFAKEFIPHLTENNEQLLKNAATAREWAGVLGNAATFVLKTVQKIADGLLGAFKFAAMTIADLVESILRGVDFVVNGWINGINKIISVVNSVSSKIPGGSKLQIGQLENVSMFKDTANLFGDAARELESSLAKQFGGVADTVKMGNDEVAKAVKEGGEKVREAVAPNLELLKQLHDKMKFIFDQQEFLKARSGVRSEIAGISGIEGLPEISGLEDQVRLNQDNLEQLQKISDARINLSREEGERILEMRKLYLEKQKALITAENKFILSSLGKMNDDLLTIVEAFGGRQTTLYKSMFAASKAFAIAEATIKIMQGVAEAAALPWPVNLAAIASVIAATASIVSNIQAVTLEFGGERAMGGPVNPNQAFLVGEKGPEMFVPNSSGTIVPNNALGSSNRVVINNYTDATPQVTEKNENGDKFVEITLRRLKNDIASEVREGRGPVNKALQDTFKLQRG